MENQLIPFDLQKAIDGEPVITRDGRAVTELHYFKSADVGFPIYTVINGAVCRHNLSGDYSETNCYDARDLFMAPKPVVKYYNVFKGTIGTCGFDSLEEVMETRTIGKHGICKITILNGEVVAHETVHKY
jgi:hypothetical protein